MTLNYRKLRRTNFFIFLVLIGSAAFAALVGGLILVINVSSYLSAQGLYFNVQGIYLINRVSVAASYGVYAVPIWAVVGGWLFSLHAHSKRGVAASLGVKYLPDDHQLTVRVHELCAALDMPPIKWVGYFEEDSINAFATGTRPSARISESDIAKTIMVAST